MGIRPVGFQVLVKMEEVKQSIEGGALDGFQLASNEENKREQAGHDFGVVVDFGPLAYVGWEGVEGNTGKERAEVWGVNIGDKVEFKRYDGKASNHPDYEGYRFIVDKDIVGVYE